MGLLNIFSRGSLSQSKIDKIAKLAANPFAQPDVRMKEMHRLIADGSPAALRGVLKRFAVNANGHIADEDEKKWLEDQLAQAGDVVLEPLADYIRTQEALTYALRAYKRVAGTERSVQFYLDTLHHLGPDAYRAGEAKLQLILQLGEEPTSAKLVEALTPFLHDRDDDVRWAVM